MSTRCWSEEELDRIDAAPELEIAVRRGDDTLRSPVPVWVVRAGADVYLRTWYRRDGGWFGRVVRTGRARVRVPGLEVDVVVEDVGPACRDAVDAAYRAKYERPGDSSVAAMVNDSAAATTLRLRPAPPTPIGVDGPRR